MLRKPLDDLGGQIASLMQEYKVTKKTLAAIWEMPVSRVNAILGFPEKELDESGLETLLRKTGFYPLMQGVFDNFTIMAVRKAGNLEPDTCNIELSSNDNPFLIKLFLLLVDYFDSETQKVMVWENIYIQTDEPPWRDAVDDFVVRYQDWADRVYWSWSAIEFRNLGKADSPSITKALSLVADVVDDANLIDDIDKYPFTRILQDVIRVIEAICIPDEDRELPRKVVSPIIAYIDGDEPLSFLTLFGVLLAPLWAVDLENPTEQEQHDVQVFAKLLMLVKSFPYPAIKVPSYMDLKKVGKNPGRYSREIIERDIKAKDTIISWPSAFVDLNDTTWVLLFDSEIGREITNAIVTFWPADDRKNHLGHRSVFAPQQDQSAIQIFSLSSFVPKHIEFATRAALECKRTQRATAIRVPHPRKARWYILIYGPKDQTETYIKQFRLGEHLTSQLLWTIGKDLYYAWVCPVTPENEQAAAQLEKLIGNVAHKMRQEGTSKNYPGVHSFELCQSAM